MDQTKTCAIVVSRDGDLFDLLESRSDVQVLGFLDNNKQAHDPRYENLGPDDSWPSLVARVPTVKAILAVDPSHVRLHLARFFGQDRLLEIIAPSAQLSPYSRMGLGCIVQRGVVIGRNVIIGNACKLNCDAQIHHNSSVGDFCTLAPGCRLLGNVHVGPETYIGAGAIILQNLTVGARVTIGAGAVVTRNVPGGVVVKGIPGQWSQPEA